jgi:hypothetical protein
MLTALHLGPVISLTMFVTELPTTNGPSGVAGINSVFWRNGHGRRSWKARDPGKRLESIGLQSGASGDGPQSGASGDGPLSGACVDGPQSGASGDGPQFFPIVLVN